MSAYGSFMEVAKDCRADVGDAPLERLARDQFVRLCERDGVTPTEWPRVEWALLPATDWDDPETGETLHIPERWGIRVLADAQ